MEQLKVNLNVNGEPVDLEVKSSETLLETLRERLELIGAKEGCGLGACGSCTVLIDGVPTRSCIVLTAEVDGAHITTIEGLGDETNLDTLQQSFMEKGAVQCGFCTPGMIIASVALLKHNPKPSEEEIRRWLAGNLCRCSGMNMIVEAVKLASERGIQW